MRPLFVFVFLAAVVACKQQQASPAAAVAPPPAAAPSPDPAPAPLPAPATAASPTAAVTVTTGGPQPDDGAHACEVEITGEVTATVGPTETRFVYVATGDCLDPASRVRGRAAVEADGKFFIEVFPPCGSDLTVCATVEPAGTMEPQPTKRYGKLDQKLHAEGIGEIEFKGLQVPIADQAERTLAKTWLPK